MISQNKSALRTPIIGKVIELNKYILSKKPLLRKDVQRTYGTSLLSQCDILFTQALREVRGKDYYKRAVECIFDIQAKTYLVHTLNAGWNMKIVSVIDMMCDEIHEHLYKIDASHNARIGKSTDETE